MYLYALLFFDLCISFTKKKKKNCLLFIVYFLTSYSAIQYLSLPVLLFYKYSLLDYGYIYA